MAEEMVMVVVQVQVLDMVQVLVHMVEQERCTEVEEAIAAIVVTTLMHDRHQ